MWINWNDAPGNKITGPHWTHLKGERFVWARHGAADVCFTPGSFAQANASAFDAALARIRSFVFRGAAVSELYAGAGPIGLSIAATMGEEDDDEGSVRCVEIVGAAAETFERSKSKLPEGVRRRVSMAISRAEDACRGGEGCGRRHRGPAEDGPGSADARGVDQRPAEAAAAAGAAVVTEKKPMTRAWRRGAEEKEGEDGERAGRRREGPGGAETVAIDGEVSRAPRKAIAARLPQLRLRGVPEGLRRACQVWRMAFDPRGRF